MMTKKQTAATAAIIIVGVLAIAGVLYGRADHGGHGDAAHDEASQPRTEPAEETVKLSDAQIRDSNIAIAQAGPGTIRAFREFPGEIKFNADRLAHVVPRLAGVVERVSADLGQQVRKGQTLAVIASTSLSDLRSELMAAQRRAVLANQTYEREKKLWEQRVSAEQEYLQANAAREEASIAVQNAMQKLKAIGVPPSASALNQYAMTAPFDGMVTAKHMTLGEAVSETDQSFTIADLGTVWAEFIVAPQDLGAVRVGEPVTITSTALSESTEGTVSYVGALIGDQTRTATARVTLVNPGGAWRPGLFITVRVRQAEQQVPVAVKADALQTLDDKPTIFKAVPGGFKAQAVVTGRSDGELVEIRQGLEPGESYASSNTFTLKAELGKSEAEHGH
ncbi:hypothetical protein GCM10023144_00120 [Pigmentiphaga soli]|uniref:Efflux RND transporter periplasmic adaptor subunit n=1 Tax=Pigmentiphaga soli TaxID=1007095 RepID=A0ABP8GB77_9BURK